MSVRASAWGVRRRAAAVATLVASACLVVAGAASADTPFGADPTQAVTSGLNCALGAPTGSEPPLPVIFFGTQGSQSCMWTWSNPSVGNDIVPFPVTGGSGTITSVTLPAMTAPGPMAVVVMTAALNSSGDPAHPQSICCQIKQVGPTFTVPAGQVTTVPQSLHCLGPAAVAATRRRGREAFGGSARVRCACGGDDTFPWHLGSRHRVFT